MEDDKFNVKEDFEIKNPADLVEEKFIDIARLESGGSFGELALIDGKPRMATIKCLTRCHFITLTKNIYKRSLDKIDRKALDDKI